MIDNEIIQSLECLMHDNCEDCPYYRDDCVDRIKDPIELSKYALDLINRQQKEVERLKYQVNRLKNYDKRRDIDLHSRLIANARAEAIKKFISCATDLCYKEFENDLEIAHTFASILTEAQKEMVGEECE